MRSDEALSLMYPDTADRHQFAEDLFSLKGTFRDLRTMAKDGSQVDVAWANVRLADGTSVALGLDIRQRLSQERLLRQSDERFRSIADHLPLIIWVHDQHGRMEFVNQTFCDYFRVSRKQMIDDRWRLLLHPDDEGPYAQEFQRCVRERVPFHAEVRVRREDGTWRWLESWGRPRFADDGSFLGHVGTSADVTERKQAEDELRRARDELEKHVAQRTAELQHRANQLSRLSSQLTLTEQRERRRLAQVLHDHLQQLLVATKMSLHTLMRDSTSQTRAQRVVTLIDEAIEASRSLTVELSPPILHEAGLAAGLQWLARWMKEKHDFDLELALPGEMAPGREDLCILLFQAVRELLLNVVKHAGVKRANVRASIDAHNQIRVIVSDEGRGFDPAELSNQARDHVHQGFGLFSIRERLLLLGGMVEIESQPGRGARFTLIAPLHGLVATTPAADQPTGGVSPAAEFAVEASDSGASGIRVLLVDDHAVVRQGLRLMLASHPHLQIVGEAEDGLEAVNLARRLQPHVVLMDFSLPKLDGVEATRRIRHDMPSVQVIGLSMYDELDRASAMVAAGAVAYLSKSGDVSEILETIEAACARVKT